MEANSIKKKDDNMDYPDDCCLFVGDLARGLTQAQFKEAFAPYGVESVEIKRDKVTNYSLGYGFAQFQTKKDAAKAKRELHKISLAGRLIRIGWAQKNTNLFIGDLDPCVTTEMLREAFRVYGPLCEEETFVKHTNYGFVKFRKRKDAERAKKGMDEAVLGNRPIRIGWGDANYQKFCVHIQFDPRGSEHLKESDIIERFEEFGNVSAVNLPRTHGSLRGFGFISYDDNDAGEKSAAEAIQVLNNAPIDGVTIQCNFGKTPNSSQKKKKALRNTQQQRLGPYSQYNDDSDLSRHMRLYPIQIIVPTPQGYRPIQYMMTSQQINDLYASNLPYSAHSPYSTLNTSRHSQAFRVSQPHGISGNPMQHRHQHFENEGTFLTENKQRSVSPHIPPMYYPGYLGGQSYGYNQYQYQSDEREQYYWENDSEITEEVEVSEERQEVEERNLNIEKKEDYKQRPRLQKKRNFFKEPRSARDNDPSFH